MKIAHSLCLHREEDEDDLDPAVSTKSQDGGSLADNTVGSDVIQKGKYLDSKIVSYGPGHAKMCLMPYANNKGADQPAHSRSLISTFVVRCLDSMIRILAISKVSRF